jgi:hypothetical protein
VVINKTASDSPTLDPLKATSVGLSQDRHLRVLRNAEHLEVTRLENSWWPHLKIADADCNVKLAS